MENTIEKMIGIVRADTSASRVYADMMLSMLPNSEHKVSISDWCYRADGDDFQAMLELMQNYNTDAIWDYEALVMPIKNELISYLK